MLFSRWRLFVAHLEIDFLSYALSRAVRIVAIVPSAAASDLSLYGQNHYQNLPLFPTVYLLHGSLNDEMSISQYTSIERYAEERQIAIVMPSGENRAFFDKGKDRFSLFLEDELPHFCERMLPLSPRKEDRYLAGLSLGGFAALWHGISCPGQYQAIGAFSAPTNSCSSETDGKTILSLLKTKIKRQEEIIPIYLAVGDRDFLLKDNRQFIAYCHRNNVPLTSEIVKGYGHEWCFWDLEMKRFLDWLPREDAYAKEKRTI